ncbi:MAG: PAS domain S-box protein, partial [Gemmatimonadales bacterium]|nr:PAS domain S-box protein [Gemmatimonadales bacterium]
MRTSGGTRLRSLSDAETLRALVSNVREGIYVSNVKGEVLDANRAFLEMIGVSSLDEFRGFTAYDLFVDPEQRARELELLGRHGAVREFEFQIRRLDGEVRTVIDACTAVQDPESGETLFHGILVDITDRQRAAQDQRQTLSLLTAALESTADGLLVVDAAGKIATFNRKFVEMWHIPEEIITSRDDERAIQFVLDQLPRGLLAQGSRVVRDAGRRKLRRAGVQGRPHLRAVLAAAAHRRKERGPGVELRRRHDPQERRVAAGARRLPRRSYQPPQP